MHKLLSEWTAISPVDALELLDSRYADVFTRRYAITQIEKLTNAQIEDYLLQLVQVIKYECYHDSPLIRHLLKCAIRNKRIGHYFYWYLKSELEQPQVSERFGLLLEAFLKGGGNIRDDITAQEKVWNNHEIFKKI
jgi:phosphatidylinositol-4,5-bisphosphate 3-kinase